MEGSGFDLRQMLLWPQPEPFFFFLNCPEQLRSCCFFRGGHHATAIAEATCLRNGNIARDRSVIANVAKPIGDSLELINPRLFKEQEDRFGT